LHVGDDGFAEEEGSAEVYGEGGFEVFEGDVAVSGRRFVLVLTGMKWRGRTGGAVHALDVWNLLSDPGIRNQDQHWLAVFGSGFVTQVHGLFRRAHVRAMGREF